MTQTIRNPRGQFENSQRAFVQAQEVQREQLIIIFRQAGVDATPIHFGHSGTLSLNALAAVINAAVGHQRIPEIHPSDYQLEES